MIPAAFDYEAPTSVEDAVALLAGAGEREVKLLAGGQSFLPVLRMRMASPDLVVDLGRIEALRGVRDDGDAIVIGAMTTHDEVVTNPLVREHAALLSQAAATVADPQVRHRGTLGGSLAHCDPAGDMGAAALALDAAEEGPGYTCYGGPGFNGEWIGAWAPGGEGLDMPEGTGIRIEPGSKVVMQVHYNSLTAGKQPDQTRLRFKVDAEVSSVARLQPWANPQWLQGDTMAIPPASDGVEHSWACLLYTSPSPRD